MKKLFILLAILSTSLAGFSQVTLSQEQIDKMSPEVQQQLKAVQVENEITTKLETASKYAGLGKEIGTAVNESLKAVSTTVVDLSETKVGKFTMFLVAYKIIGTDILQLFMGILWIIIIMGVSFSIYRNNCKRLVLKYKKWNSEAKGWDKEFEEIDENPDYKTASVVIFCAGLVVSLFIIFL